MVESTFLYLAESRYQPTEEIKCFAFDINIEIVEKNIFEFVLYCLYMQYDHKASTQFVVNIVSRIKITFWFNYYNPPPPLPLSVEWSNILNSKRVHIILHHFKDLDE